jgi:type IV secretion system protein VirD4
MLQNERVPEIPVLFVLDEFLALGPFPKFRDAIRTHAGAGVRLWFFLQDVPTLEEHYPTAWKTFFNTSVKMFFGTDETFTGRLVSEFLGDKTGAYATHGLSVSTTASAGDIFHSHGSTNGSVNSGAALAGRPLLTPQEVVRLLSGSMPDQSRDGLAFIRGVDPIKARLVPWFRQKSLQARVGERSHKP